MEVGGVLAALPQQLPAAVGLDGDTVVVACGAADLVALDGPGAFARLDRLEPGWWAGWLAYDLGRSVERVAPRPGASPPSVPDAMFIRFAAFAELDRRSGHVRRIEGRGEARRHLAAALDAPVAVRPPRRLPGWTSSLARHEYETGVRTIVDLIEAGDCYQVNLTRRLSAPVPADPVALFAALESGNPAPHGSFLRAGAETGLDVAVVSASPERFLARDGRAVETRPIKGTAVSPAWLRASAKDRAENVMIVDLARNDLGRVCEPGTIAVPDLCRLETHPGLVHLVSTVRGTLRDDVGLGGLLHATFPPASVTGAPKPRVLQAIEDLEPVRRGVYCGAVGWIDANRDRADLSVAIRTFVVTAAQTQLGVGAGITADSDPAAEWHETELKAARLLTVAGADEPAELSLTGR